MSQVLRKISSYTNTLISGNQMDHEWTYRPPVLVGERVVWLGDAAGAGAEESSPSSYQPHHGTVSWIGRVPEMGNDWAVGIEFVSSLLIFVT